MITGRMTYEKLKSLVENKELILSFAIEGHENYYKNNNTPFLVYTKEGYKVLVRANNLKSGRGIFYSVFTLSNPYTTENIHKWNELSGDKFCLKENEIYKGAKEKMVWVCSEHGEFSMTWDNRKQGEICPRCAKNERLDTSLFIIRAKEVHGEKYDYKNSVYTGIFFHVRVICQLHGEFLTVPYKHLQGQGCTICENDVVFR